MQPIFDFKSTGNQKFDLTNPDHLNFIQPISQTTQITYDISTNILKFTHQHSEELGGIKISLATVPGERYLICTSGKLCIGDSVLVSIENTCLSQFRLHEPSYFTVQTSQNYQTYQLCFKAIDDTTVIYFQTDPQADCCQKIFQFNLQSLQIIPQDTLFPGIPLVSGFIGEIGPQGTLGPSGPLVYPNAPEGAVGSQGPQAFIIPQAPQGPSGPDAPPEILNNPGPQGPKGPLGPPNPATPAGSTGPTSMIEGNQGPQGVQGGKGAEGVRGIQGESFIEPIPTREILELNWQTNTGVTLIPSSMPGSYEFNGPNEIILNLPNFSFTQNINPNPFFIEAFLPVEIRPSISYSQPIVIETSTNEIIGEMRVGPTKIQIARGLNSITDLFQTDTNYTIFGQSYRYLLTI